MKKQFTLIIVAIFLVLTAIFVAMKAYAPAYHFVALESANGIMALLSLTSYYLVRKQMDSRPEAFVRGVYSASFLKLMVCMIAILVYVLLNRAHLHKASVFILFGIYALYTIVETWILSKLARE
jgi:hypothetical protein